ncbi:hypothetical protein B0T25DRAFT_459930 [Lasiosphaeria hispida]|uniref:Uncharacterized protein n=1 Tax=Lasiosphaeria hispida TaxID=260671 RepID=A0AAJ0HA46_9PEZI|nr:hypothetical protein B0T25DRAFT_459930 [Lasiosphaeria hispida]
MFSLLVLAAGDVIPLLASGTKLRITDPSTSTKTLSWATFPTETSLDASIPLPLPFSLHSATREYIELDLLLFTSLPSAPTPASLTLATDFITTHNLTALSETIATEHTAPVRQTLHRVKQSMLNARGARPGPGPLAVFTQTWLGLALDSGLPWILSLPATLRAATADGAGWAHGAFGHASDARVLPAAGALLSHFGAVTEPRGHLPAVAEFLTAVLDPRMIFFTTSPRRIATGDGGFAVTPVISNRSYLAVPMVLAHVAGSQERGWVLEPFDPASGPEDVGDMLPVVKEGEEEVGMRDEDIFPVLPSDYADRRKKMTGAWRLRRRQAVFGCGELGLGRVEGGEVVVLERQRVYGAEDYDWGAIFRARKREVVVENLRG